MEHPIVDLLILDVTTENALEDRKLHLINLILMLRQDIQIAVREFSINTTLTWKLLELTSIWNDVISKNEGSFNGPFPKRIFDKPPIKESGIFRIERIPDFKGFTKLSICSNQMN